MLGLIQRSRDIFQLEEGVYQLRPEAVDLLALARRVGQEFMPLARARQVGLAYGLAGRPAGEVETYLVAGEPGLLEVLLENLVKNAIEAAPAGSTVSVGLGPAPAGGHLLDVHNLGVVPAEVRERFFEPYVTSGKQEGTGLGTHSARLIARAHGGEIAFTTSEQEGTHLLVSLPAQPPTAKP